MMRRAEARPATLSMHPLASPTLRNILRTHPVKNTRTVPIHRNPKTRHSRAGGNPVRSVSVISKNCRSVKFLDSHFRGNDAVQVSVRTDSSFPHRQESGFVRAETYAPSFPHRREFRSVGIGTYRIKRLPQPCVLDSHFRGNDGSGIPNSNPPQPTYAHPTHLPYSPVPERADKVRCRRRAS